MNILERTNPDSSPLAPKGGILTLLFFKIILHPEVYLDANPNFIRMFITLDAENNPEASGQHDVSIKKNITQLFQDNASPPLGGGGLLNLILSPAFFCAIILIPFSLSCKTLGYPPVV